MKKFLIFLVSLVVVVCFGLTTFYFIRNDEIITIETKELYCNAGDVISLESLNIKVKKPHRKTKFNYNGASEEVASLVSYNEDNGYYSVSNKAGGTVELVITTTNKKYSEFKVILHIGNGEAESPYYIFSETDLNKIGVVYNLNAYYALQNNIILTSSFKPIGFKSYADGTGEWQGFSGKFNGNGYTISGLNLSSSEYADAGLFAKVNSGAVIENLTIDKVTINGEYSNAGALAGVMAGCAQKVAVKNVNITNNKDASNVGAFVGQYLGKELQLASVDNATISVSGTDVKVGGFAGIVKETAANATYANNVEINATEATGEIGGYAGEFVIGTNSGAIMQSYANVACSNADYAAFVGKVTMKEGFDSAKANMLKHFVGNIAIVAGKTDNKDIVDTDVVKTFDNTYFKNVAYAGETVFYHESAALYLVRGYVSVGRAASEDFVYYAINSAEKTMWDTDYIWKTYSTSMPTLVMGSIEPAKVSGDYFRRGLDNKEVNTSTSTFQDVFSSDLENQKLQIVEDVDLTSGWTPISLTNCTIDGNGKTIKVNLDTVVNGYVGLFTKMDNCSIKNLNIEVVGVSANATNIGALAGLATSSVDTISTIENVNVKFLGETSAIAAGQFGGLVGSAEKTDISNVSVEGLVINPDANIENVGGIVATLSGTINTAKVSATVYGTTNVGGVVAVNNGSVLKVTESDVVVGYNKAVQNAQVGGITAINNGSISDVSANVKVVVTNSNQYIYIGGVAATNGNIITNVSIAGKGIALGTADTALSGTVYVGGIVAVNNSSISSTYNTMANVGANATGANYRVAGVASINNGNISEVLTSSNLYGNYVAGVAVDMKNSVANVVDQVAVGVLQDGVLTANEIKGDKYVAGLVVDFRFGTISNAQLANNLVGLTSNTRTSLMVLIFPNGASVVNSTVNSTLSGNGDFYRDSWVDFETYANKAEFGYGSDTKGYFNAYTAGAGDVISIVINSKYNDNVAAKSSLSMSNGGPFGGTDYDDKSFVIVTADFTTINSFVGEKEFQFVDDNPYFFKLFGSIKKSATLTFNFGDVWVEGNGISLNFLKNVK